MPRLRRRVGCCYDREVGDVIFREEIVRDITERGTPFIANKVCAEKQRDSSTREIARLRLVLFIGMTCCCKATNETRNETADLYSGK